LKKCGHQRQAIWKQEHIQLKGSRVLTTRCGVPKWRCSLHKSDNFGIVNKIDPNPGTEDHTTLKA